VAARRRPALLLALLGTLLALLLFVGVPLALRTALRTWLGELGVRSARVALAWPRPSLRPPGWRTSGELSGNWQGESWRVRSRQLVWRIGLRGGTLVRAYEFAGLGIRGPIALEVERLVWDPTSARGFGQGLRARWGPLHLKAERLRLDRPQPDWLRVDLLDGLRLALAPAPDSAAGGANGAGWAVLVVGTGGAGAFRAQLPEATLGDLGEGLPPWVRQLVGGTKARDVRLRGRWSPGVFLVDSLRARLGPLEVEGSLVLGGISEGFFRIRGGSGGAALELFATVRPPDWEAWSFLRASEWEVRRRRRLQAGPVTPLSVATALRPPGD
jgi:hypothetical protein